MSRITKFLHQQCTISYAARNSVGETILDNFGDVTFEGVKILKCRREALTKDVQMVDGSIVRSTTRYFLGPEASIHIGDYIDGHAILSISEYINSSGTLEGFECYV